MTQRKSGELAKSIISRVKKCDALDQETCDARTGCEWDDSDSVGRCEESRSAARMPKKKQPNRWIVFLQTHKGKGLTRRQLLERYADETPSCVCPKGRGQAQDVLASGPGCWKAITGNCRFQTFRTVQAEAY